MPLIRVYPTPEALARAAAEHFVGLAAESIRARGRFAAALAGGSTPAGTYRRLAAPEFARRVDWKRVHIFWGDERAVPPDHPESNYRMASETLLRHVPIPQENIHRIPAERPPAEAALACEAELLAFFGVPLPRFDLILLGMGEDGHTASLFPHSPALGARERLVVAQYIPQLDSRRITFTLPLINAARNIVFLVQGERKARRIRRVLFGPFQAEEMPAQSVRPSEGTLLWLLDEAAAPAEHR